MKLQTFCREAMECFHSKLQKCPYFCSYPTKLPQNTILNLQIYPHWLRKENLTDFFPLLKIRLHGSNLNR